MFKKFSVVCLVLFFSFILMNNMIVFGSTFYVETQSTQLHYIKQDGLYLTLNNINEVLYEE